MGKLVGKDRKFVNDWLDRIVEEVRNDIPPEQYDAGAHRHNRYSYFTNLCEGEAIKLAMDFARILEESPKPRRKAASAQSTMREIAMDFANHYLEDRGGDFSMSTRYFGPLVVGYVMHAFGDYLQSIDDLDSFGGVSSTTEQPRSTDVPPTQESRRKLRDKLGLPENLAERVIGFQRQLQSKLSGRASTSTIASNPETTSGDDLDDLIVPDAESQKAKKKVIIVLYSLALEHFNYLGLNHSFLFQLEVEVEAEE